MEKKLTLSVTELNLYTRQLILPEIGREGQLRLKASRALVVGAGGLGSPAAMYLAAAGVGTLGILDFDRVELANLNRQILHDAGQIGMAKIWSAHSRLNGMNPHIQIELNDDKLTPDNAAGIIAEYDIVLGCVDNFAARYAINAACVELGRPHVYAAIAGFEGQAAVFCHRGGACYRCFFRDPPPEDWRPVGAEKGVLGAVAGVVGSIQATEAVKVLLGIGESLSGRLLLFDALAMRFREIPIKRDPACPVCGGGFARGQAAGGQK